MSDVDNLRATSRVLRDSRFLTRLTTDSDYVKCIPLLKGSCHEPCIDSSGARLLCGERSFLEGHPYHKPIVRYCHGHPGPDPFPVCQDHTYVTCNFGWAPHWEKRFLGQTRWDCPHLLMDQICNPCYLKICEQSASTDRCACATKLGQMLDDSSWSCQSCVSKYLKDLDHDAASRKSKENWPKRWDPICACCRNTIDRSCLKYPRTTRHGFRELDEVVWCLSCSKPWYVPSQQCSQGKDCSCDWHRFVHTERGIQKNARTKAKRTSRKMVQREKRKEGKE